MESYIVRIYRRTDEERKNMTGLVEEVDSKATKPFQNSEELVKILLTEKSRGKAISVNEKLPARHWRRTKRTSSIRNNRQG